MQHITSVVWTPSVIFIGLFCVIFKLEPNGVFYGFLVLSFQAHMHNAKLSVVWTSGVIFIGLLCVIFELDI